MRTVLVRVTAEDIEQGRSCDKGNCPIARAVKRVEPFAFVGVGPFDVSWVRPRDPSALPRSARRFISAFDNGLPVNPFNFRLAVPE